jgi:hypothetical protein
MLYIKMVVLHEKPMCKLRFFKTKSVTRSNVVIELCMEMIHLLIMLSNVGHSIFKRLVVFCIEMEREGCAMGMKILIKSRKCFHEGSSG